MRDASRNPVSEEAAARSRLRATFDSVAASYADARPTYPDELVDALVAATGIGPGSRLLEVGCGPGTATLPLARLGCRITAVELGAGLAAEARRRLAAYPDVGGHRLVRDVPAGRARLRPGLRRDRLALGRPGGPLPAGPRRAAAGRAPGVLVGADHVAPRGRRPVLPRRSRRSTTRSARACRTTTCGCGPGELPDQTAEIEGERAVRGDRRAPARLGDDLRRRVLPSRCSTPSPATSRWRRMRSERTCTPRSAAGWPCGPTACSGGTGARCCTWPPHGYI